MSRTPSHPFLCQQLSCRLARLWVLGGRPCAFSAAPGRLWGRAAVFFLPAAAAADPPQQSRQRDRPARHQRRQLPRLLRRPRCRRPLEGSPRSWAGRPRRYRPRAVCGGISRQRYQQRGREGWEKRCERARKGVQACSRRPSPQAGWRGQGTAAHPWPVTKKVVRLHLLLLSTPPGWRR